MATAGPHQRANAILSLKTLLDLMIQKRRDSNWFGRRPSFTEEMEPDEIGRAKLVPETGTDFQRAYVAL